IRGGLRGGSAAHAESRRTQAASTQTSDEGTLRMRGAAVTIPRAPDPVTAASRGSHVEPEVHDVAVANDIVAALEAHLAGFLGALLAVAPLVVRECDDLRADEALFEISVDDAGRLRRGCAMRNRPRAHFLRSGGEVRVQAEALVPGANQAVESRLGHAPVGEEQRLVVRIEIGDLRFHRGADRDDRSI